MTRYWDSDLLRRFPTHTAALDRIAELEELERTPDGRALRVLGLSGHQTKIVRILAKHGRITRDRLTIAVWGTESADDPRNVLAVQLVLIRRKLAGTGISIETIWGGELLMSPESVALWNAAVEAEKQGMAA